MTMPDERYRSLVRTRKFLMKLSDAPSKFSATEIKHQVSLCLRHYPEDFYLDELAEK